MKNNELNIRQEGVFSSYDFRYKEEYGDSSPCYLEVRIPGNISITTSEDGFTLSYAGSQEYSDFVDFCRRVVEGDEEMENQKRLGRLLDYVVSECDKTKDSKSPSLNILRKIKEELEGVLL